MTTKDKQETQHDHNSSLRALLKNVQRVHSGNQSGENLGILNPLPNNKILGLSKIKAFADDNFNNAHVMQFFFDTVEYFMGKG